MKNRVVVFRIYDSENECYWYSPKNRTIWDTQGAAKNAWNVQQRGVVFSKQKRFECHCFELRRIPTPRKR